MLIYLFLLLAFALPHETLAASASSLEREATEAFNRAEYGTVITLLQSQPPGAASKPLLRLAVQSAVKLGRPEEALDIYDRLVPSGQPDDPSLLRQLSVSFLTAYVRDPKEYI